MSHLKGITIVSLLLVLTICNSTAQNINYGLSVGFIRSSPIQLKESFQNSIIPENYFTAMAIVELSNESPVRIQTGLKYFKMGYTFDYNLSDLRYIAPPPSQSITTISYLAIPIDINYSFSFLPELYLSGGIEAAKAISAKSTAYYDDGTTYEYDIMDNHRKLNLLLFIGFGVEYKVNNVTLFIEPEYSRSLKGMIHSGVLSNLQIEQFSLNIGMKF